jgi:S-adenosyl-L-methionine hydrolase (adenosine-forming)
MIIALLTDFGTRDYFVGAMKGVILSINEEAKIIDLTHEIEPQNIKSAGFILASCYRDFPPKTIFVAVVDPGVGSARRAVLVKTEDYFFIAPDNGLLSFIFENEPACEVFELTNSKFFRSEISRTFHGRDLFAPAAAWLSTGIEQSQFGREINDFVRLEVTRPKVVSAHELEAEIIQIDRFGNLVTNLKREDLAENFSIKVNETVIEKHHNFYAQAQPDEIFTIWGSAGYLEIAANQNSASKLLKVRPHHKIIAEW